jgi:chromosome segregation ATPase
MSDELELVQAESQSLRQQAFALEVLRDENSRLRHRIVVLETQQLDYQSQLWDAAPGGLCWRGKELESIITGIDQLHPESDDREQLGFFADEMAERLTEVERRFNELSQSNERLAECQTENAKLRSELAALRESPSLDLCIETARLMHERDELESEIGRLKTAKEALAVDDLQLTIDSLTSERDELQRRIREQAALLETVGTALEEGESNGQSLFAAVRECLSIVKNSQLENIRANDELRILRCQVHALKEDKTVLAKQLDALKAQLDTE